MYGDTNKAQCIGAEQRGQRGGQKGASDKCQRGSLSRKPRLISPEPPYHKKCTGARNRYSGVMRTAPSQPRNAANAVKNTS